jgi:hypothetical protein
MDKYLLIRPTTLLIPDFSTYDSIYTQDPPSYAVTNLCDDKDSELSEMTCR